MRRDQGQAGRPATPGSWPAVRAAGSGPNVRAPGLPLGFRAPAVSDAERDEAVVVAARAGDPLAIEELLAMLGPSLLRAVRALMGPAHPDLEDVVQDVLIAVVDALPSLRGDCTLLQFAIRIATRRTTTARRHSRSVL